MAIRYKCPRCESQIEAPDDAAGKSHTCPSCLEVHRVPVPTPQQPRQAVTEKTSQKPAGEGAGDAVTGQSEGEGGIAQTVSVKCEKCGHLLEKVVFRSGMKCPACGEGKMAPVVDTTPEPLSWKQRLLGVSIFNLPKRALIATGIGILALSFVLGWLLSSLRSGEGAMSDVVMACPKCAKYYYVDPHDSTPQCRKCKVRLEKGYVCADCKKVFAASAAEKGPGGQPACPYCKSANVRPLGRKVIKNLGLK